VQRTRGRGDSGEFERSGRLKALIIDDERLARSALRRLLKAHSDVDVVGEAADPEEALRAISRFLPDVIFLDVEMPGCSGFDLLEKLEDVPEVIFTTAYDEYAVRAFEINALDYLVKPVTAERLASALARAQKTLGMTPASAVPTAIVGTAAHQIFVRDKDRCWIVRVSDIVLMESEGNYTRLHFGANAPLVYRSLSAIEERLNPSSFFRANRAQIINLRCIQSVGSEIEGRLLVNLTSGKQVEISRRQAKRLRELLSF
jgi:two-component system, LytTR family, response regulator